MHNLLYFEYLEEGLRTLSLKRKHELKQIEIGAATEGKVPDHREDYAWEEARREESRFLVLLREAESALYRAEVIEIEEDDITDVRLGAQVTLESIKHPYTQEIYLIAGTSRLEKSGPYDGRISNRTPLGKALLYHKKGDIIDVDAPEGIIRYKIIDLRWGVKSYLEGYVPTRKEDLVERIKTLEIKTNYPVSVHSLSEKALLMRDKNLLLDLANEAEFILLIIDMYDLGMSMREHIENYFITLRKKLENLEVEYKSFLEEDYFSRARRITSP